MLRELTLEILKVLVFRAKTLPNQLIKALPYRWGFFLFTPYLKGSVSLSLSGFATSKAAALSIKLPKLLIGRFPIPLISKKRHLVKKTVVRKNAFR